MTLIAFVVVVFFMMIMPGCSSDGRPATTPDHQVQGLPSTIPPTPDAAEEGVPGFLEVEQFSLTKENLRVAYRVTNVFPHDIWVCANVNSLENQDSRFSVETEICDGTLHIRRRANLEQKAPVNFRMYAVYDRLQPRASRSDTVLLPLPIRGFSPARAFSFARDTGLLPNPIVLKQVVFEVGYFNVDLSDLLPEEHDPSRVVRNAYLGNPNTAFVSHIKPDRWDGLHLERSVQVMISDVKVPGAIPRK